MFDFLNNSPFNVYESIESPTSKSVKINLPLSDEPIELEGFTMSDSGKIVPKQQEESQNSKFIINNTEEHHSTIPIEEQQYETTSSNNVNQSLSGNKKKAMNFFTSKGLSNYAAAGLVGNLIRESSLNPNAVNPSSKAFGIAQWLGDRKKKLFAKYGKNPTFDQQLEFVWEELNSSHKKGLDMLKRSQSVEEAAANAFGWYEFSVGPKGAIAEMRKHGQDGLKSYNQGIKFSKSLLMS